MLAREAVAAGTPGLDAVVARFGREILRPDGQLDRPRLGSLVFQDAHARQDLEAIVHPRVYRAIADWFQALSPAEPLAVADIPLLFETGRDGDFDRVVVAACPLETQVARLTRRDALSVEEARRRIAAQWPIAEKLRRADYAVDTSRGFAQTDRQVESVWGDLRADAAG